VTSILRAEWQGLATGTHGCLSRIDADEMSSLDIVVSDTIIAPFTCCDGADYFTTNNKVSVTMLGGTSAERLRAFCFRVATPTRGAKVGQGGIVALLALVAVERSRLPLYRLRVGLIGAAPDSECLTAAT
jgi:hypothetical protein